MRLSRHRGLFVTRREAPSDATAPSHVWMSRAGFLHRVAAGVYVHGPLLRRVLARIEAVIRDELAGLGAEEVTMPTLQPRALWEESGRWRPYVDAEGMLTVRDRTGAQLAIGPTHEEVATAFVRSRVRSARDLPVLLYQVQTKVRDEPRPRGGLLRTRELLMKDAYSFDTDRAGMERSYAVMATAYEAILARCGLDVVRVRADPGGMGGGGSEEFVVLAETGEDDVVLFDDGTAANREVVASRARGTDPQDPARAVSARGIEVGHVFRLGTRYSAPMRAVYADATGTRRPLWAGSYGIGVTRLAAALVEQHHDERGMRWPVTVAPHSVALVQTRTGDAVQDAVAVTVYRRLREAGVDVVWDDRDVSAGVKLADADLVGVPLRIVVGRDAPEGRVELTARASRDGDAAGERPAVLDALAAADRAIGDVTAQRVPPVPLPST